jgi:hypothetical protein
MTFIPSTIHRMSGGLDYRRGGTRLRAAPVQNLRSGLMSPASRNAKAQRMTPAVEAASV